MGHYLPTPQRNAVEHLVERFGAQLVDFATAYTRSADERVGVVVVFHNSPTDQPALFAFDRLEFDRAHRPDDDRQRTYLTMDRVDAEWFSGFGDCGTPLTETPGVGSGPAPF